MNTFASTAAELLVVAGIFLLLALPSLVGHARDRRIDRELRAAEQGRAAVSHEPVAPVSVPLRSAGRRAEHLAA
ncbi:hypothetical protein [Streptomyces sp. NBC_01304]|uniref:hypothetical protein n=1 Tax=Streptomyces sp. NBC_01304 TaxID=2903818 RepID=UPI002E12F0A7|nr:hypothetical protein OG430_17940 [Streptomyces sp. NBC_01304]